jgi:lipopolysaccharide export system permease protein
VSLISRYVFREAFWSWLIVLSVLFVILMTNQFAGILGDAAADLLPRDAVFAVFWLTAQRYATILAPIALFLGVMLALARLNRDSEMAALLACGIGPGKLLRPIGLLTVLLASGAGWLAMVSGPRAALRIEQIKYEAEAALDLGIIEAGQFTTPDGGRTVFHAERVDGDQIYDVFWEREIEGRVVVIRAERGERLHDPETGKLSFVLYNGTRYEGQPGRRDFSIVEFGEHGIPIREASRAEFVASAEMKPTAELVGSDDPHDQSELQWRLSAPLSLLVLALLAVPLSRSSPREGRYARLGVGLLVYVVYANSLSMARIWVERGDVPTWLGVWWVHAGLAVFAGSLFAREAGWFVKPGRGSEAAASSI